MSLWTRTNKPKMYPNSVAGLAGWIHPSNIPYEILVPFHTKQSQVGTPAPQLVTFFKGYRENGDATLNKKTAFSTGDTLKFAVRFNAQIAVVGQPYMTVNINGIARQAKYSAGSGSATLLFVYRLIATDIAAATGITVTSPLVLNGGTIKKFKSATNATLTFTPPTITTLTASSLTPVSVLSNAGITNGTHYVTTNPITLTLTYTAPVTVTGSPQIQLNINAGTKQMTYVSGSGTAAIVFSYVNVVAGDICIAGQFTTAAAVALNSGTLKDASGANVTLAFTPPVTTTVSVN